MNKQDKVEFELLKREVLSMHEKVNKIDTSLHGLLDAWTTVGGVLKACKWLELSVVSLLDSGYLD